MTEYVCHNCLEHLSYTGPRDGGEENEGFILLQDQKVILFCSEDCAEWWDAIIQPGPMLGRKMVIDEGEPVL